MSESIQRETSVDLIWTVSGGFDKTQKRKGVDIGRPIGINIKITLKHKMLIVAENPEKNFYQSFIMESWNNSKGCWERDSRRFHIDSYYIEFLLSEAEQRQIEEDCWVMYERIKDKREDL